MTSRKVLNHADRTIAGVYDRHDYLPEARVALETWGEYLRRLASGEAPAANVVPIVRPT